MTRAVVLGLALVLIAGVEVASADEGEIETWAEFRVELVSVRHAIRASDAALEAGAWRQRECRFQSLQKPTWTQIEEQLTAECAVAKWSVAGGYTKLYQVADCESGWWRKANNGGRYLGLFQHSARYWSGRVASYNPDSWEAPLSSRWQNSRSAIIVSTRMAHGSGWGAWSCA